MKRTWNWFALAGCLALVGAMAGRLHFARGAEDAQAYERTPAADDAASRLDRIIEKLDRVVDRMHAERMGPRITRRIAAPVSVGRVSVAAGTGTATMVAVESPGATRASSTPNMVTMAGTVAPAGGARAGRRGPTCRRRCGR